MGHILGRRVKSMLVSLRKISVLGREFILSQMAPSMRDSSGAVNSMVRAPIRSRMDGSTSATLRMTRNTGRER